MKIKVVDCNRFLKDMGLENESPMVRGMACRCLHAVIFEPGNGYIASDADIDVLKKSCYPDDVYNDKALMCLLDLAGYWSNDLIDYFINECKESKLGQFGFEAIFDYLKEVFPSDD